jgi:hypothetical protein
MAGRKSTVPADLPLPDARRPPALFARFPFGSGLGVVDFVTLAFVLVYVLAGSWLTARVVRRAAATSCCCVEEEEEV